jgi:glycolate oxidase FAD binding subunit
MAGLDRLIDYPAADMTITVEAGMTMAALNKQLATQRQRLPIDVPRPDRATVGGIVATNTSGPRRYGHGTIRDYVLGIRAVDGRGKVFSGGGRVVKNAAGYNVCRLMVGSLGTLGVMTQVTLMVRPMPQTSALMALPVADLDAADCLLSGLTQTQTLPMAIELVAGPVARALPGLQPPPDNHVGWLVVGFEGNRDEVDWMLRRLAQEWKATAAGQPITVSEHPADRLWTALARFPADLQVGVLPSAIGDMISELLDLVPGCSIQAHAGNGILEVKVPGLPLSCTAAARGGEGRGEGAALESPDAFATLLREKLRPAVAAAKGNLVVLAAPEGSELTADDVWGPPSDGIAVMQAIKQQFDPHGILNPGRFIFN